MAQSQVYIYSHQLEQGLTQRDVRLQLDHVIKIAQKYGDAKLHLQALRTKANNLNADRRPSEARQCLQLAQSIAAGFSPVIASEVRGKLSRW